MLSSIWHGSVDAEENNDVYNYKKTLEHFLRRYSSKSNNTKKGMMGELLSHILIPKYLSNLNVISIMKNKEESSIRKGFDIVYFKDEDSSIWYCEVKSGGDEDTNEINFKNKERINEAKKGIKEILSREDSTVWQSVLTDVRSTIFNSKKIPKISAILKSDFPNTSNINTKKNVILSSVIYKDMSTKICPFKLIECKSKIDEENIFSGLIVFSIQKTTYIKIEKFLMEESNY